MQLEVCHVDYFEREDKKAAPWLDLVGHVNLTKVADTADQVHFLAQKLMLCSTFWNYIVKLSH